MQKKLTKYSFVKVAFFYQEMSEMLTKTEVVCWFASYIKAKQLDGVQWNNYQKKKKRGDGRADLH